jgi:DNA invertase Pin-like site-specific DNA recombinase
MQKHVAMQSISPILAAQYVRMSTEDQQYSIESQKAGISEYAVSHGFKVIQTYEDAGKSGVVLKHRKGLLKLLQDVLGGKVEYHAILVYDVSRWGRFQDADESAYYEFICKRAGVPVHYCAEQFSNDETLSSSLVKAIKRSMAGEFSRELGIKVFNGKRRLAQMGFWVGGEAGFGYQRLMISADGNRRQKLKPGERKRITTDRVVLIPGKKKEVETVRYLFQMAAQHRLGPSQIARRMNDRGKLFQHRLWSNVQVSNVLTNPKYAGWNVWARRTCKLQGRISLLPPAQWIVKPGAFPALVDQETFDRVQKNVIRREDRVWSNGELKRKLSQLLAANGRLSESIILNARGMCSTSTLKRRLGGYREIYETVGYRPLFRDFYKGPRAEASMRLRRELVECISTMFPGHVQVTQQRMRTRSILLLDNFFYVAVLFCKLVQGSLQAGHIRQTHWVVSPNPSEYDYITLVCRLNAASDEIISFHLFRRMNIIYVRCYENDPWLTTGRRLGNLNEFYRVATALNTRTVDDLGQKCVVRRSSHG